MNTEPEMATMTVQVEAKTLELMQRVGKLLGKSLDEMTELAFRGLCTQALARAKANSDWALGHAAKAVQNTKARAARRAKK